MDEQLTLAIDRLGAQGDGIAALADGRQVFVSYTLPGERVRVSLAPGADRATLIAVEQASPDRVAPICPQFTRCGGCAVQHLSAARYLAWKRELVATAFAQRGLMRGGPPIIGTIPSPVSPKASLPPEVGAASRVSFPSPLVGEGKGGGDRRTAEVGTPPTPNPSPQGEGETRSSSDFARPENPETALAPIIAIPHNSRRRTTLAARRTAEGIITGYHAAGSHGVVAVDACPLLVSALARLLPQVPEIVGPLLGLGGEADVTLTATSGGGDMTVAGVRRPTPTVRAAIARAAEAAGLDRLTVEREMVYQLRAPSVDVAGVAVPLPPAAFLQASAAAEAALRDLVVGAVGKARRVADLFAGLGTFTLALGKRAEVLAVEGDAGHVAALEHAARVADGLKPLKTLRRDLFRDPMSARELKDFDAVVLDPPRAGAKAQAEALAASAVPTIVMVSCNPATLARDVRTLVDGGYSLAQVTPIDQFVFSAHVEVVAVLRKGKAR